MPTNTRPRTGVVKTADGYLNVELVKVGKWAASRGDGTVTPEDIAAMAAAANDPLADRVPIKLGHSDSRFQDADGNPPDDGDGNPAYGRVENIRASEDGTALLGDLVAMPSLLADVADSAYPDRSVEFVPGKRIGGKTYRAVLTGLALLGETAPAVKGLNDLYAKFAAQLIQPIVLTIHDDTPTVHQSAKDPADGAGDKQSPIVGGLVAVSAEVRKALGIADDATDEKITEALAAQGIALMPAAPTAEEAAATEAARVQAEADAAKVADDAAEAQKVAASQAPATITVDAVALSALQADAAAGRQAREEQIAARRDGLVGTALREGRIHPIVVAQYRAMLDSDEKNTAALLAALPVMLPVTELGHAGQPAALSEADSAASSARVAAAKTQYYPRGI